MADIVQYRLIIQLKGVRDVAIPLGAFTNISCTWQTPLLPRSPPIKHRRMRTAPPVLLPRQGSVILPSVSCICDFGIRANSELLPSLTAEPVQVELWHHDKYTQKILLGIACVDLSEILSVRSAHCSATGSTTRRQEQTVHFIAPQKGMLPSALADGRYDATAQTDAPSHVALLDVTIQLDTHDKKIPDQVLSARGAVSLNANTALSQPRIQHSRSASRPCTRKEASTDRSMHDPNEEMARLVEWRRKEEARWRAALEKREEERFELLTREWQMAEKRRAADAKARLRTVSEVTRTLKQKLNQLIEKEELLDQTVDA